MQPPSSAQEQFDRELDAVRQYLDAAAAEIVSPLSELVSARIRAAAPHLYASSSCAATANKTVALCNASPSPPPSKCSRRLSIRNYRRFHGDGPRQI